jgi:hypothetical protein
MRANSGDRQRQAEVRRTLRLDAVVGVLALGCFGTACSKPWIEFQPQGGGFAVSMPATPESNVRTVKTASGDAQEHVFLVADAPYPTVYRRLLGIPSGFYVSYRDLSRPPATDGEAQAIFEEERNRFVAEGKGKVLRQQVAVDCQECRVLEFVMQGDGDIYARVRLYLVRDRLFQVGVGTSQRQVSSSSADRFFASFRLVPRPTQTVGDAR